MCIRDRVSDMEVPLLSDERLHEGLKTDVVGLLTQANCKPDSDDDKVSTPSKKRSRTAGGRLQMWDAKTKQVLWILENRLCVSRRKRTLVSGLQLLGDLG